MWIFGIRYQLEIETWEFFVEMIFEVIGEGGTKGKENRAREEGKQEDNLGEVSCHSDN